MVFTLTEYINQKFSLRNWKLSINFRTPFECSISNLLLWRRKGEVRRSIYIKHDMIFGINLSLAGVKEVACCGCCTIAVKMIKKYTYASAYKSDSKSRQRLVSRKLAIRLAYVLSSYYQPST